MSEKKIHRNIPQLLVELLWAQITICIWGRGTGKTEGPMAQRLFHNIHALPRSNGFILGETYSQIKGRTLPALMAAWEKLGFIEDKHYWIGKMPPPKLLIPKPYRYPRQEAMKHYISTYTGAGIYLFSQDRPGISNGARTHWGAVDEAKFINKKQFDEETIPTMIVAPPESNWVNKEEYRSLIFLSDMPDKPKASWLLKARDEMDMEIIEQIFWIQKEFQSIQQKLKTAAPSTASKLEARLRLLRGYLSQLRIGTTYFSTATTLDNIHAVGLDSIMHMIRTLSPANFDLSVLNKEREKVEENFYKLLDEDKHGYNMDNHSYIDTLRVEIGIKMDRDCRWDADIIPTKPLDIACDYNNKINCVVTGQMSRDAKEYRFLSSTYVLSPLLLEQCVKKWHEYYKHHQKCCKVVHYYYDNTAIAKRADTHVSFADKWVEGLTKLGWTVIRHYIGQASEHESRKNFFDTWFQGLDSRLPKFKFNKTNAASWQVSAELTGVRYVGADKVLKKDKRPEEDLNVPPEKAPHIAEAGDTLAWGKFKSKTGKNTPFVG
jgi:hypothetical protein